LGLSSSIDVIDVPPDEGPHFATATDEIASRVKFAPDSPLEEEGFEPLVPVSGTLSSHLLIKWQRVRPTLNEAL
jgi:hypothetical protein